MPYIRWLDQTQFADRPSVGEKAAYLGELIHAGLTVPRGFCITADAYRDTFDANNLGDQIVARLAATEMDDPVDLENGAEEIRAWIENASWPVKLLHEIENALAALAVGTAHPTFAVRASRTIDDVPNPAASGLPQAYLAVTGIDAILSSIKKCWTIPWNSRAIYFRHRKKMEPRQMTMAVVIQSMLNADAAGVLFTANPLTGASNEIHIDATWGLGEAVIAARWQPDHFVVAKDTRSIQARVIANKPVMEIVDWENGEQTVAVVPEKQAAASLTDVQVIALAELGQRVEARFKQPQDIEWCCCADGIFLLQARPLAKR